MKTSIIINGVEFVLQENHLYKPGNLEAKYKVLYFNELYDSWCFFFFFCSKREFTIKNIKKYYWFA